MAFKRLAPVFALALCSLLSILGFAKSTACDNDGLIAVPSYVYPCSGTTNTCAWHVFENGSTIVVINPASGPGTTANPDYTNLITALQSSTVSTVLGYVSTSYGTKTQASVIADINTYYNLYFIDGIFLDEGPTDCTSAHLAKYKAYDDRVKHNWGSDGFTALNWGVIGPECYLTGTNIDLYVTFEGNFTTYLNAYPGNPSWFSKYDASTFWHIVHSTPNSSYSVHDGVALSQERQAGYYYFTDAIYQGENTPYNNPYNVSPSQIVWNAELPSNN